MQSPTWTYDDILIEPVPLSEISHKKVSLETRLVGQLFLDTPIVMAPMDALRNNPLMYAMQQIPTLPWLDRYMLSEEQAHWVTQTLVLNAAKYIAIAVSTKPEETKKRIELCGEAANGRPLIVKIDVANGSSVRSIKAIEGIKKKYGIWCYVFSGNVCTKEAALMAIEAGADGIMVGIGGGSACSTRTQTGIGKGNAHAVHEIATYVKENHRDVTVVADGGFKKPGDMVKALMLGADVCMSGRLFQIGDSYRGMASHEALETIGKGDRTPEGECLHLAPRTVENVIKDVNDYLDAIKSAMSYVNCSTIQELQDSQDIHYNFVTRAVYDEGLAR